MDFRQFEHEFLRLAFTTDIEISVPSLAFVTSIPLAEAQTHLDALVSLGTLELGSDDEGHLRYTMPDRPAEPMGLEHPALAGHQQISTHYYLEAPSHEQQRQRALVVRRMISLAPVRDRPSPGRAMAGMFLNALVCPGVGSMVGGRTRAGLGQLALFTLGIPLLIFTIGLPLMIVAWVWGMVTGAQLLSEARD